jgi:uncharacterized membrane-anchored protein
MNETVSIAGEEVSLAGGKPDEHPLRAFALAELHARPFAAIDTPRRILHYAFMVEPAAAKAEREALSAFCTEMGAAPPAPQAKYHRCLIGNVTLRWESHAEFSTYTWGLPAPGAQPFEPAAALIPNIMASVPQPGPLLVALDLHLMTERGGIAPEEIFDRASLARARVYEGAAVIATDFQPDAGGFVRVLVVDRSLGPDRAGALIQRLLEIETYRMLALLALPLAQGLAPSINGIEERLAQITEQMRESRELGDSRRLLDELTALAADLEAGAASASFRFGASRAYHELVRRRLEVLGEQPVLGYPTWAQFLERRLGPAMRTCINIEERQRVLSEKLARAAQFLRTRVEVELEQQNRDLLQSNRDSLKAMNERTRLQLRLQWTVEWLSIAAISYYVVGLLHYLFKGLNQVGVTLNADLAAAISVPSVVIFVALLVSYIRRRHIGVRREAKTKNS